MSEKPTQLPAFPLLANKPENEEPSETTTMKSSKAAMLTFKQTDFLTSSEPEKQTQNTRNPLDLSISRENKSGSQSGLQSSYNTLLGLGLPLPDPISPDNVPPLPSSSSHPFGKKQADPKNYSQTIFHSNGSRDPSDTSQQLEDGTSITAREVSVTNVTADKNIKSATELGLSRSQLNKSGSTTISPQQASGAPIPSFQGMSSPSTVSGESSAMTSPNAKRRTTMVKVFSQANLASYGGSDSPKRSDGIANLTRSGNFSPFRSSDNVTRLRAAPMSSVDLKASTDSDFVPNARILGDSQRSGKFERSHSGSLRDRDNTVHRTVIGQCSSPNHLIGRSALRQNTNFSNFSGRFGTDVGSSHQMLDGGVSSFSGEYHHHHQRLTPNHHPSDHKALTSNALNNNESTSYNNQSQSLFNIPRCKSIFTSFSLGHTAATLKKEDAGPTKEEINIAPADKADAWGKKKKVKMAPKEGLVELVDLSPVGGNCDEELAPKPLEERCSWLSRLFLAFTMPNMNRVVETEKAQKCTCEFCKCEDDQSGRTFTVETMEELLAAICPLIEADKALAVANRTWGDNVLCQQNQEHPNALSMSLSKSGQSIAGANESTGVEICAIMVNPDIPAANVSLSSLSSQGLNADHARRSTKALQLKDSDFPPVKILDSKEDGHQVLLETDADDSDSAQSNSRSRTPARSKASTPPLPKPKNQVAWKDQVDQKANEGGTGNGVEPENDNNPSPTPSSLPDKITVSTICWQIMKPHLFSIYLSVLAAACPFGQIVLLEYVSDFVEDKNIAYYHGIIYAIIALVLAWVQTLCIAQIGRVVGHAIQQLGGSLTILLIRLCCLTSGEVIILPTQALEKGTTSNGDSVTQAPSKEGDDSGSRVEGEESNTDGSAFATPLLQLITTDVDIVSDLLPYLVFDGIRLIEVPAAFIYLLIIVGWPALCSLLVFLVLLPINKYTSEWYSRLYNKKISAADRRSILVEEIIAYIRVIKYYAWEEVMEDRVRCARRDEMNVLRQVLGAIAAFACESAIATPLMQLALFVTIYFGTEGGIEGMSIATIFQAISIISIPGRNVTNLAMKGSEALQVWCGILRLQGYVDMQTRDNQKSTQNEGEDDNKTQSPTDERSKMSPMPLPGQTPNPLCSPNEISFGMTVEATDDANAFSGANSRTQHPQASESVSAPSSFHTTNVQGDKAALSGLDMVTVTSFNFKSKDDAESSSTASTASLQKKPVVQKRETGLISVEHSVFKYRPAMGCPLETGGYALRVPHFIANPGDLILLVGKVGSGKSTFIEGLCGRNTSVHDNFRLHGRISIAPQQPWLVAGTVRNNIILDQPFNEDRYKKVLQASSLACDLKAFSDGDATMVGSRGSTLSGGQRQRISIARALYRVADIYLFDDPLSALDAHVSRAVFDNGICSFLKGKTRIVATHQLGLLPYADRIYVADHGVLGCEKLPTVIPNDAAECEGPLTGLLRAWKVALESMLGHSSTPASVITDRGLMLGNSPRSGFLRRGTTVNRPEIPDPTPRCKSRAESTHSHSHAPMGMVPATSTGSFLMMRDPSFATPGSLRPFVSDATRRKSLHHLYHGSDAHNQHPLDTTPKHTYRPNIVASTSASLCPSHVLPPLSPETQQHHLKTCESFDHVSRSSSQLLGDNSPALTQIPPRHTNSVSPSKIPEFRATIDENHSHSVSHLRVIDLIEAVETLQDEFATDKAFDDEKQTMKRKESQFQLNHHGTPSFRASPSPTIKPCRSPQPISEIMTNHSMTEIGDHVFTLEKHIDEYVEVVDTPASPSDNQFDFTVPKVTFLGVLFIYLKSLGAYSFWIILLTLQALVVGLRCASQWWLGKWSDGDTFGLEESSGSLAILGIYAAALILSAAALAARALMWRQGSMRPAESLFSSMLGKVIHAPSQFFDTYSPGNILTRFTKDVSRFESIIPSAMGNLISYTVEQLGRLIFISALLPYFSPVALVIIVAGIILRPPPVVVTLKALADALMDPITELFVEGEEGSTSIRVFGLQSLLMERVAAATDKCNAARYMLKVSFELVRLRVGLVIGIVTGAAILCIAFLRDSMSPATASFVVATTLEIIAMVGDLVEQVANVSISLTSAMRVVEFTEMDIPMVSDDAQPSSTHTSPNESQTCKEETNWNLNLPKSSQIDPSWPQKPTIDFTAVNARYRNGLPLVIKNLNLHITAGERVGVCGRTGSGKSTLIQCILRMVPMQQGSTILIDGVCTSTVSLKRLRRSVTVIPQEPVVFEGTIRFNLDPLGTSSDDVLLSILDKCQLLEQFGMLSSSTSNENLADAEAVKQFSQEEETKARRLRALAAGVDILETTLRADSLSVGQKQLLCLARAAVRGTNILILDEATSSVDAVTDELIQRITRNVFANCTVIAIAHRVSTIIDYDKVLVLDAGRVLEFDSPSALLRDNNSVFSSLVEASKGEKK